MSPSLTRPARRALVATALALAGLAAGTGLGTAPVGAVVPAQCAGEVQAFVCGSYESFVGATPSPAEVDYWAPRLPAKTSFFLATLGRSLGSRRLIVGAYYAAYGDRGASGTEIDYWVGEILKPDGSRRLQAALYDEWESTPEDLVGWAYHGLMGREPLAEELTYWAGVAEARGGGRMADILGATPESRRTKVRFTYYTEAGYYPDEASEAYWAERLRAGTSHLDMRIAIKAAAHPHSSSGCTSPAPPVRPVCQVD